MNTAENESMDPVHPFIKRKSPKSSPKSSPRSGDEDLHLDLGEDLPFGESKKRKQSVSPKQARSPVSTPKGSPVRTKDEGSPLSPGKLFIETQVDLSRALKSLVVEKDCRLPALLKDTESRNIQKLFEEYDNYKKRGGDKPLVEFIDHELLMTIKEFELGDVHARDADVYLYLKKESTLKNPKEIIGYLFLNVQMDPKATSGSKRLLSLMKSLRAAKTQLGLHESSTNADDVILPLDVQKQVLLSKMPKHFQKQFNLYSKFRKEPADMMEFYRQLKEVEKEYAGSWDSEPELSKETNLPDDDVPDIFQDYQEDHEANLNSNRRRTRSSTKR